MNAPADVDKFTLGLGLTLECADLGFAALTPAQQNDHKAFAAAARLAEYEALMYLAAGKPYPFSKKLQPLVRAINDFVESVDAEIIKPITSVDDEPGEEVQQAIAQREEATLWLNEARVAGCALLVHLTRALDTIA